MPKPAHVLIKEAQNGNEKSLEMLLERFKCCTESASYRFGWLTSCGYEKADVLQEARVALVGVFRSKYILKIDESDLEAYLTTCASSALATFSGRIFGQKSHNTEETLEARNKVVNPKSLDFYQEDEIVWGGDTENSAVARVSVESILSSLSPRDRLAAEMLNSGASYREIGNAIGLSSKSSVQYILRSIRKKFESAGWDENISSV